MAQPPRLLQVFLGNHGANEVYVTPGDHELTCTCPGYKNWSRCKHTKYVRAHLDETGGYAVQIPDDSSEAMLIAAGDPTTWRDFVLHHAPVVVL